MIIEPRWSKTCECGMTLPLVLDGMHYGPFLIETELR